ncbi:MAG: sigma-70 family RNA polymerase sigma factor [Myxococcota bacterium]|nr:sigma-70 family RNA polymerase sigma factor [bacterium]MDP6075010.1 sigma-70 family RNA polymerase sigma factor [Myxococcota bacterium]MDP6244346.1 sigma-70 family RNA polymerase sigma factor [Myxococcota bacterium]MDP7076231.1 sigma-70 family RNA polymerase sigma factor [Myxococcota bacterium]MDP7301277.1 sigma-70 family RNA polymerase sigma factor [Myxococcota bacterium]
MTVPMVEAHPATVVSGHARGLPLRTIDDPDAALVERWQSGDEAAFETLVRRHERRVFGLLMRMLGNRDDALDVSQETFLSLHRHGHRFRREARFSTFVYRVAANAALNRRRSLGRKRSREQALARRQEAGFDRPQSPRDPEAAAVGVEAQARVQRALLELPDDLRLTLVLYDLEGQSYGDIARSLGIPEGTVKSRIHRARNALREELRSFVAAGRGGKVS